MTTAATATTYTVAYRETENTTKEDHDFLIYGSDYDGATDLDSVRDTCVRRRLTATLYDKAGFVRGWVHADGSYRLT